ncbi:MAG: hypothetical protein Q9168_008019 [Polycauliona sp. 1 TL-2023]
MIRFLVPALLGLIAIRSVVTTPLPGPTDITLPSDSNADWDHSKMTANVAVIGTLPLNVDSCLMATTRMLHHLSGCDFAGTTGATSYICQPFTAVAISIRGIPVSSNISVRIAVSGAYLVGRWLAQYKFCTNTVFALAYDRRLVGYIEFTGIPVQLSLAGSSNDTQEQTSTSDQAWDAQLEAAAAIYGSEDVTNGTRRDEDRQQLNVGFRELPDQDFTKFELFANIYAQLAHIAPYPPNQRIERSWTVSNGAFPQSEAVFTPLGSDSVVEYRHAADTFMRTAYRVIQRRVKHGLAIRLKLAEDFIARGLIWHPKKT